MSHFMGTLNVSGGFLIACRITVVKSLVWNQTTMCYCRNPLKMYSYTSSSLKLWFVFLYREIWAVQPEF